MGTYGPAYDEKTDGKRVRTQMECIRDYMTQAGWRTLQEIAKATRYPESSISAQLRHLKKPQFGAYLLEKRRRGPRSGTWEYRLSKGRPQLDGRLF